MLNFKSILILHPPDINLFNGTHRDWGNNWVLLSSVQEFIELEGCLLLIFFMFTQSHKFSIFHCHILKSKDVWKRWFIKQIGNEQLLLSAIFTAEFELVELVSLEGQQIERFGIFKIVFRLRDRHVFMWQSLRTCAYQTDKKCSFSGNLVCSVF